MPILPRWLGATNGSTALGWVGRNLARGVDALAVAIILFAAVEFVVLPRFRHEVMRPAPPIRLAALDGGSFALRAHRGRVVFLDFWASWCEPCKRSLPLVERFARDHPQVDVFALNEGEKTAEAADFARAHGLANVILDPSEIAAHAYGVDGFPTVAVIDAAGNLRAKWVGYDPDIETTMADALRRFSQVPRAAALRGPVLAIEDDPNSLNTIRNTPFGWQLGPLTQGYLFLVDDRGRLVPDRARFIPTRANGGISPDGRTITYQLRTGRWSDGAAFDARDVAFTLEALRNPRTSVPDTSAVAMVASYAMPNSHTFVVHLRHPSAPFVTSFLTLAANDPFSILPQHIGRKFSSLDQSSLDANPIGLGPFRLTFWRRGDRLEFERNPYYWRGPARSSHITVRVVPDARTRLLLARNGDVDAIEVAGLDVDAARQIPALRLTSTTINVVDYLELNLHSPLLHDRSLRTAIARAIDRRRLASDVYRSTLVPTNSVQFDARFRATQAFPAFDTAGARRALGGRRVELDLAIPAHWRKSENVAVVLTAQLAAAGITASIHAYSEGAFWGPKDAGGILESARYDLALTSWSPALDPDRSYLFGCAAIPPGGGNSMFFCDRVYDRDEARGAQVYEPELRAPYYRDAGNRLITQLPIVPLGFERRTYAINAQLRGFRPNVMGRDFWNAWEFARVDEMP